MRFSILRRLRKNWQSGSAAIEFAFVAPVFFFLMLGILDLGMMTFGQFALQNAVTNATRLLRTGQVQQNNYTNAQLKCANDPAGGSANFANQQAWFYNQVCCGVTPYLNCSQLRITVTNPNSFGGGFGGYTSPSGSDPVDPNTGLPLDSANYNVGSGTNQSCLVLLVRASYTWTFMFPGLGQLIGGTWRLTDSPTGNTRVLNGTAAVRSEPFNSGVTGC